MALDHALVAALERRSETSGFLTFPCVPSMLDFYHARLATLFRLLGRPFSDGERDTLRAALERNLAKGFAASPHSRLIVAYETEPPLHQRLRCRVATRVSSIADEYDRWIKTREPPWFGSQPDARVMTIAGQLGTPACAPILDVGAGTGRNAIPLAKAGHPVDAVELVPALSDLLREAARTANASVRVHQGSFFDERVALPEGRYALIVLAEVVASHFRSPEDLRKMAERAAILLASRGILVFNAFLPADDSEPDPRVRELSQVAWSTIFTRRELARAFDGLPLHLVADDSAYEYEKEHAAPAAWPPTGWFEDWSLGRDICALPPNRPAIEMRWLLYRRS